MHGRLDTTPLPTAPRRHAFSLVELLVVIAIIAILVALLFPALGYCHRMAKQSREAAAGAQLMAAYTVYANDNRGSVLPGYATDAMVSGPSGSVVTDDTGARLTGQVARRYPWRLAPALDFNFRGLYDDPAILERYQNQADRPYVVSVSPSFGINADFVGGKSSPGFGFNANATRAWGQFYITRLDQIRRSDRLLVFASARGVDASLGGGPGGGGGGGGGRLRRRARLPPRQLPLPPSLPLGSRPLLRGRRPRSPRQRPPQTLGQGQRRPRRRPHRHSRPRRPPRHDAMEQPGLSSRLDTRLQLIPTRLRETTAFLPSRHYSCSIRVETESQRLYLRVEGSQKEIRP